MALQALLVDLDGTIWDSWPWYARVVAGSEGAARAMLSSLQEGKSVASLIKTAGVSAARFTRLCLDHGDSLPLYEGVDAMLRQCEEKGVPVGVVTNLPGWIVRPMIECKRLGSAFATIIDYGSTNRHKPRPDPIRLAISRLRIAPSGDVVYVGDTENDRQAAVAAGITFAWAAYGYGSVREPCLALKRLDELLSL